MAIRVTEVASVSTHRHRLLAYDQVEFLKARERYALLDAEPADEAHRGASDGDEDDGGAAMASAQVELKRMLQQLDRQALLDPARTALERIEAQLGEPDLPSAEETGAADESPAHDEARIQRFLARQRGRSGIDASELVRTLTVAMMPA